MHRIPYCSLAWFDYLSKDILENICSGDFRKVTVFAIKPEPCNFNLLEEEVMPKFSWRFLKFTTWAVFVKRITRNFLGQGKFLKTRAFR